MQILPPCEHTDAETFSSGARSKAEEEIPVDREAIKSDEDLEPEAEEVVGNSHPGPRAWAGWGERAKRFYRPIQPSENTKDDIRRHAGKTVGILLAVPCVIVGTSLHVAGAIINTTGSVVGGVGDAMLRSFQG